MFIEEILLNILILTAVVVAAYILLRIIGPVFQYFWQPHKIVLDAERKKRIAQAKLEATRLEIEASKTWDQCGKEVDNRLLEEEAAAETAEKAKSWTSNH